MSQKQFDATLTEPKRHFAYPVSEKFLIAYIPVWKRPSVS